MPITPLSTPYTAEYKPLGLEAFAAPLSKMQEKFDLAKSEIDKTKYALSRMSQDDTRAKNLLAELDAKTVELSGNLSKTGNYRQAAQKLQDLNEWFNTNPEFSGMKNNYNSYKENYEVMRTRVDKDGNMTENDFKLWNYNAQNKFKGTNYDKSTGNYNTGNFTPKAFNREAELETLVLQIANSEESNQINQILSNNPNLDEGKVAQQLKSSRTIEDTNRSIRNFILTGDRFKDWKQEDAEMEFFMKNDKTKKAALQGLTEDKDPLSFSKGIIKKSLPELQELNDQVTKILNNPKIDPDTKERAGKIKADTEKQIGILQTALDNNDAETIEQEAGGLYVTNEMGYFDRIALAGADVVDFIKEASISMSGTAPSRPEALKLSDTVGTISTRIGPINTQTELPGDGQSSPFAQEELAEIFQGGEDITFTTTAIGSDGASYEKEITVPFSSSIAEMYVKNVDVLVPENKEYRTSDSKNNIIGVPGMSLKFDKPMKLWMRDSYHTGDSDHNINTLQNQNEKYSETTLGYQEIFNQKIDELGDNIKEWKVELNNQNLSESERNEIGAKIKNAQKEQRQATVAKTTNLKDLDILTTQYLHDASDKDLLQIVKDSNPGIDMTDEVILESVKKLKENFKNNTTATSPEFLHAQIMAAQTSTLSEANADLKKQEELLDNNIATWQDDVAQAYFGKEKWSDLTEVEKDLSDDYQNYRTDVYEEGYDKLDQSIKDKRSSLRLQLVKYEQDLNNLPEAEKVTNFSPSEIVLNKIYMDFEKSKTLGSSQYYQIPEIFVDPSSDAFSSGMFTSLVTEMVTLSGDQKSKANRVLWNSNTRESKEFDPAVGKNYNLTLYDTDHPIFVGMDLNGDAIMAFTRKETSKKIQIPASAEVIKEARELLSAGKSLTSSQSKVLQQQVDAQVKTANPDRIYLTSAGFSNGKPMFAVNENFSKMIEASATISNENERIETIEKQRANYAPFYMNSNPRLAAAYNSFANTLKYRAENGIIGEVGQGSASGPSQPFTATLRNGKEMQVTKEYNSIYKTTKDGQIIVQFTEILRDPSTYEIIEESELPAMQVSALTNLPTALAKLDLTFGTGASEFLQYYSDGGQKMPITLAYMQGDIYKDPKRMENIIR